MAQARALGTGSPFPKAIYNGAEAVRVCLGDPTAESDDAMAILKELRQKTPLQDVKLQDRLIDDRHLQSVIEVMKRLWVSRSHERAYCRQNKA